MEFSIPDFDWNSGDPAAADAAIRAAVRLLAAAAGRRELRCLIGDSRERWSERPQITGHVHAFFDEWFFQLRGRCRFEFSPDERLTVVAGDTLLVPRGVPHRETAGRDADGNFVNLVLVIGENSATLHLAQPSASDPAVPDVYRMLRMPGVQFYRGASQAVQNADDPAVSGLLLEALFRRMELDVGVAGDRFAPSPHHLAGRAKAMIDNSRADQWYTVTMLAEELLCSPNYLSSVFHKSYGVTLKEFLIRNRLENAQTMLLSGRLNASEVAAACGFQDAAYFARIFRRRFGCTPSQLSKRVDGVSRRPPLV
ncbi:MAG: helix-turn-helix domain-containing protein [Victivallaceae bacterium]|nr:helix-turn-helix domain-containing protein [Victivallaceae bacterium]